MNITGGDYECNQRGLHSGLLIIDIFESKIW